MVKSKVKKSVAKTGRKRAARAASAQARKAISRNSRKAKKTVTPTVPKSHFPASTHPKSHSSGEAVEEREALSPNHAPPETLKSQSGVDLTEKIKELVR